MLHVTVTLPPETERKLRQQASLRGQTLEVYLQKLAEREAASVNGAPPAAGGRPPTFEELTAPISQAVKATGMSDEEVGDFFEEVVEERRAERRPKNS